MHQWLQPIATECLHVMTLHEVILHSDGHVVLDSQNVRKKLHNASYPENTVNTQHTNKHCLTKRGLQPVHTILDFHTACIKLLWRNKYLAITCYSSLKYSLYWATSFLRFTSLSKQSAWRRSVILQRLIHFCMAELTAASG